MPPPPCDTKPSLCDTNPSPYYTNLSSYYTNPSLATHICHHTQSANIINHPEEMEGVKSLVTAGQLRCNVSSAESSLSPPIKTDRYYIVTLPLTDVC